MIIIGMEDISEWLRYFTLCGDTEAGGRQCGITGVSGTQVHARRWRFKWLELGFIPRVRHRLGGRTGLLGLVHRRSTRCWKSAAAYFTHAHTQTRRHADMQTHRHTDTKTYSVVPNLWTTQKQVYALDADLAEWGFCYPASLHVPICCFCFWWAGADDRPELLQEGLS